MFKVILEKTVVVGNKQYNLQRKIELPFVPFVGLSLKEDSNKDYSFNFNLLSVVWHVDLQEFHCSIGFARVNRIYLDDYKEWNYEVIILKEF